MRTKDWFTIAGVLVFVLGLLTFWAALPPPPPSLIGSPKFFLDAFNVVHGVGSVWIGIGIAAAGVIVIA